jgi:hypothetical protein
LTRHAADQGHCHRHEKRGGDPLSRDVAQNHDDPVIAGPQDIIEVSADLLGRFQRGMNFKAGAG